MANLQPFIFPDTGSEVRVITRDDEPWFVAGDVAAILGFREAYHLTRGLDDDEKGPHNLGTPGGGQTVTVISEAGLYSAILRSRVPAARAFKRWVTHEVLPEIRRTGRYQVVPRTYAQALRAAADAAEARERAEAELAAALPKAESWEYLASAEGDLSVADAAKVLSRDPAISMGQGRLFEHMAQERWVYRAKGDGRWRAYQSAVDTGRLTELPQTYTHPKTEERVVGTPQIRITIKGLHELHRRLGAVRQLALPASGSDAA
ncbi:phage antirepressor [Nocardiopsis sp. NPDC057823]|uniref:phage antirepressor n=1 Tax=Nocardiopsis sp. NPDC057823 TaxID=3346256 RepID=UPI00366F79CE